MRLICETDRSVVFYNDELEKVKKYFIWDEESIAEYANYAVGQRSEDEIAEEVNDIRECSKEISEAKSLKEIADIRNYYAYIFDDYWEIEDDRPKNLQKLKRDFGTVSVDEKEFVLLEEPKISDDDDEFGNCFFVAKAINDEDEMDKYGYQAVYEMIWNTYQKYDTETPEVWKHSNPNKVDRLHVEYDVEYKRFL